jgi:hypothetical protein
MEVVTCSFAPGIWRTGYPAFSNRRFLRCRLMRPRLKAREIIDQPAQSGFLPIVETGITSVALKSDAARRDVAVHIVAPVQENDPVTRRI